MKKKFIRWIVPLLLGAFLLTLGGLFLTGTLESPSEFSSTRSGDKLTFVSTTPARPTASPLQRAALDRFKDWAVRYVDESNSELRAQMIPEGLEIARSRREVLLKLIQTDPERALHEALPREVLKQMPVEMAPWMEKPLSGKGDFALLAALAPVGQKQERPLRREVSLGESTYHAFVYGLRERQTTSYGISLHGIAIDDVMAVHERPFRPVSQEEWAQMDPSSVVPWVSIEHQSTPSRTVGPLLEATGEVFWFCCRPHAQRLENQVREAESAQGPEMRNLMALEGEGSEEPIVSAIAPSWSTGEKQLLVIRVDFSDLPGEPLSQQAALNLINPVSDTFFREGSYGKTSLAGTVAPTVYRMPKTGEYYAVNDKAGELHQAAQAAASDSYSMAAFDRIMVCFGSLGPGRYPASKFGWAGLAQVEGKAIWMNNAFDHRVSTHEIGHTYGLLHANFWDTTDNTPAGVGTSEEYGDPFDSMGGAGGDNRYHFNPWSKFRMHWLSESSIEKVTANGSYRLFRFDHPQASGIQALKIERDKRSYWIAYRKQFSSNPSLDNGAYVFWGKETSAPSELLDMTPGSKPGGADANDAGLQIGSTFEKEDENIVITVTGKGGIAPLEYLDINLQVGTIPPFITQQPESQAVGEGNAATFRVEAKGTPVLTYQWQHEGVEIPGATEKVLTLQNVQAAQGGNYTVVVRNTIGSVTSLPAQLGVEALPQSLWTSQIGGPDRDEGTAVALEPGGDVYLAGNFRGTASLGNTNLTSSGVQDLFLCRYNSEGHLKWYRSAGGPAGTVTAHGVATSGTNAVFLTGSVLGVARFGETTVGVGGLTNLFLARYDSSGTVAWVKQPVGGESSGADLVVAPNGDLIVAATFTGPMHLGGTNILVGVSNDVALVRFDAAGNTLWARSGGGPSGLDAARGVAVDPQSGFIYVVGTFAGRGTFGNISLNSIGRADFFLAKYTSDGEVVWVRQGGSNTGNDEARGVVVDAGGNVIVTGTFQGVAAIGEQEMASRGKYDLFLAKYDPDGDLIWAKSGGSVLGDESGNRVRVSPAGELYVAGSFSGNLVIEGSSLPNAGGLDALVAKFGASGNLIWLRSAGGQGDDVGNDLCLSPAGPSYITGGFSGDSRFINNQLLSKGAMDAYLFKISGAGTAQLRITLSGQDALVSWPVAASGYVLEGTGQLGSVASWTPVPVTPVVSGSLNTVRVPTSTSSRYFRLRK